MYQPMNNFRAMMLRATF